MRLPAEIFDMILGLMADDPSGPDIETMKTCNLVSSFLSGLCERHLYACVFFCIHTSFSVRKDRLYFDPDPDYARCQISITKFRTIQTNKPWISQHVRRLGIVSQLGESWAIRREWWEAVKEALLELRLDRIQSFTMFSHGGNGRKVDPSIVSGPLGEILKSPVLNTLRLYRIPDVPFHKLYTHNRSIHNLDLDFVTVADPPVQVMPTTSTVTVKVDALRWCGRPEQQQLIAMSSDLQELGPKSQCFDLSSLSSFSILLTTAFMEEDVALSCTILEQAKNLRSLTLQSCTTRFDTSETETAHFHSIDAHNRTLEKLVLIWDHHTQKLLGNIPEFLAFKSTFIHLHHIALQIFVAYINELNLNFWDENEWIKLGQSLSRFPALRLVEICVASMYPSLYPHGLYAEKLKYLMDGQDILLKALDSSIVRVEFSFTTKYSMRES